MAQIPERPQDDENYKYETKAARGIIAPPARVRPRRDRTNQENQNNHEQYQTHAHLTIRARKL